MLGTEALRQLFLPSVVSLVQYQPLPRFWSANTSPNLTARNTVSRLSSVVSSESAQIQFGLRLQNLPKWSDFMRIVPSSLLVWMVCLTVGSPMSLDENCR